MLEMRRLGSHLESLEEGVELANQLYWYLRIIKKNGTWFVKSGESVILSTDNKEALDAFLYGLGIAYAGIPEDLHEMIADELKNRGFAG